MLQFLVDVRLPNCAHHIPQLQTRIIYYGGLFWIEGDELQFRTTGGCIQSLGSAPGMIGLRSAEGSGNLMDFWILFDHGVEVWNHKSQACLAPQKYLY